MWVLWSTGVSGHLDSHHSPFPAPCVSQEEAKHRVHGCCLEAGQGVWAGLAAGWGAPSWEFACPPCPWKHSGAGLSPGSLLQCLAALLLDQPSWKTMQALYNGTRAGLLSFWWPQGICFLFAADLLT